MPREQAPVPPRDVSGKPPTPATDYMKARAGLDRPPPNPLFDAVDRRASAAEQAALKRLQKLAEGLANVNDGSPPFLPYLVVRSGVGDHGSRPFADPFSASPDIYLLTSDLDPSSQLPQIINQLQTTPPADGVVSLSTSTSYTLYAHIWNLGSAPVAGVRVDFFFSPMTSCGLDPGGLQFIGTGRVDLGPRTSLGCHQLVKCPTAFTPPQATGALLVQAHSPADPITTPWHPEVDRHVARRDFGGGQHTFAVDQHFAPGTPPLIGDLPESPTSMPYERAQTFTVGASGVLRRVEVLITGRRLVNLDIRTTIPGPDSPGPVTLWHTVFDAGAVAFDSSSATFVGTDVDIPIPVSINDKLAIVLSDPTVPVPPALPVSRQVWLGGHGRPPDSSGDPAYTRGQQWFRFAPGTWGLEAGFMGFRTYVCS